LPLDVTSPPSIATALATLTALTSGTLDYLLNYAGCGYTMPTLDADIPTCTHMFDVNVWGPLRLTQALAPLLVAARGTVVMAGSTAELVGVPFQGPYCASKAALRLVSETLRAELKPLGVRVLYVTTGNVRSNWFNNVPAFELPRASLYAPIVKEIAIRARGEMDVPWMEARVYADRVVGDVLAGREGRVFRGATASILGWGVAWLPGWLLVSLAVLFRLFVLERGLLG
ncbi:NAD(P)-binding protein, partial [Melanomma pulvis-pyrius CBS 109.77]